MSTEESNRCRSDFLFLEELGEGSFSTVYLASEVKTSRKFAVKVCYKKQIIREKKVTQIFREKEVLRLLSTKENAHPFIIQLLCTFQDSDSLYFVLTLATRRDLLRLIKKHKEEPLTVLQCRFIAAELVSAMGHIHKFSIVHRDIKPENMLLQENGHILLTDFGCAKQLNVVPPNEIQKQDTEIPKRRSSFVGTSHYISPEILHGEEVQQACDYWALGVILFEILAKGRRPFAEISEYLMYQKILKLRYSFGEDFPDDEAAKKLISALLVLKPNSRLGSIENGGSSSVKQHEFFKTIDWDNLPDIASPLL